MLYFAAALTLVFLSGGVYFLSMYCLFVMTRYTLVPVEKHSINILIQQSLQVLLKGKLFCLVHSIVNYKINVDWVVPHGFLNISSANETNEINVKLMKFYIV